MKLRLTKKFSFEMAHALTDYHGLCRNIHGHTYHLDVTVENSHPLDTDRPIESDGLMIDFKKLKAIVQEQIIAPFDHALVLAERSPFSIQGDPKVIRTPFEPTTENLLLHFERLLRDALPQQVRLCSLRLGETDTSFAELVI